MRTGIFQSLGKYKEIVIAVALFLVFDLGVLMMNFYVATLIKQDAVGVNLAGRQRMLSQRMVKTLYQIDPQAAATQPALVELRKTFDLFDSTLTAFLHGGKAIGGNNQPVMLAAANSPAARQALTQASELWLPLREQLQQVLDSPAASRKAVLQTTITAAAGANLKLLNWMNDLTTELEVIATAKASRLRWIQSIGISLALINFIFILFHFIRKLRASDEAIESARRETDDILLTVKEGLFLLNPDMTMGSQYSIALEGMLNQQNLAGKSFIELLNQRISEETLALTQDYIQLLFQGKVKENLITSLNPLVEVEVTHTSASGRATQHYLDFAFNRVFEDKQLKHLLVTVTDVTHRVKLQQQLESLQSQAEEQLDVLLNILKVDQRSLVQFLQNTSDSLLSVNELFKEKSKQYQEKLQKVFQTIHKLKGDASLLGLGYFERKLHDFEDSIAALSNKSDLNGNDFLALTVRLEHLIKAIEGVQHLIGQVAHFIQPPSTNTSDDHLPLSPRALSTLVTQLGERQGKAVACECVDFDPHRLPAHVETETLQDIIVQLLRNSVTHGIESPNERLHAGKQQQGTVTLAMVAEANQVKIIVRDDGRGIDLDALRAKAIQSGKWSEEELGQWSTQELSRLIFVPGLSTATTINADAGRGIGMGLIKTQLKRLGAKISLKFAQGQYCQFAINFPITPETV